MATTNLPVSVFKLATVRAPRKAIIDEAPARRIVYTLNSAFYTTLKTNRAGANPRPTMIASATTFKTTNALYIADLLALKALFPGFDRIDDYLRTAQRNAVKADLKALVEGATVLNQTAAAYVSAGGYSALKSRVWDNVFALTVLGGEAVLRTEEVRVIRLLNVIEKIAANDTLLDTGAGIFSAYLSNVLLPADVFPMPDVLLPDEPTTEPIPADPVLAAAVAKLANVQQAYTALAKAYADQVLAYRAKVHPSEKPDPTAPPQAPLIGHDPLALEKTRYISLDTKVRTTLEGYGVTSDFVYVPTLKERLVEDMRELGRTILATSTRDRVVRVGSSLIQVSNECAQLPPVSPCSPFNADNLVQWPGGAGHIRPLGIADLRVVQSQLYKYELGEVAHVENILKGESKKRTFRNLQRTETSTTTDSETTRETEKETQTTERFELHQEANNVVQQDQQSQIGVTASYGFPAGGSASLSASTASSTSEMEATTQATTYAKDVMERALNRVIERTRTTRTVTTIIEHEDTTEHGFTNVQVEDAPAPENIAGVYRWLDKVYYNKVVNYGKRLLFEFIIPEPAAFHIFSAMAKPASDQVHELPPPFDIASFNEIRPDTYDALVIKYGAVGVKPPPTPIVSVNEVFSEEPTPTGSSKFNAYHANVQIPAGYKAMHARVSSIWSHGQDVNGNWHYVWFAVDTQPYIWRYQSGEDVIPLSQQTGTIAINSISYTEHYSVAFRIDCEPTAETMQQWQMDTYAALKTAYDQKVSEYNRWVNQQTVNTLVNGNNPAINRQVEQKELKKHCIEFISGQRFESFDAMRTNTGSGYPEFSFAEAAKEGRYIQFFEQAFEWEQISYYFYPYFWARKREWVNILKRDENDPLFMNFLQAGAARVLVPVRPSYTKAVLHYLSTGGEIWGGEDVPLPDDPMYVSIVEEIMEADGYFEGSENEGEPWLSKVPTSLVYLTHPNTPNDLPDYSADLPL
ncbi:MAG: hypothetical protein IT225_05070 [Flavobacteriales bacterium]|nr:hypothetical protein [Flavobacteriales bacterium]MCC6541570.1 hypothetical protein [Flavobacteriales bacterium]